MSYTSQELKTIADTILSQMGGGNKIATMIGVKQYAYSEVTGRPQLLIRFKAKAANKANCVTIILESSDLYTMKFQSLRGLKLTDRGEFENLYADMLKETFEQETKLYLSL